MQDPEPDWGEGGKPEHVGAQLESGDEKEPEDPDSRDNGCSFVQTW